MTKVAARLTKEGELLAKGIDTRNVNSETASSLLRLYPLDGTAKGFPSDNRIDATTWSVGGAQQGHTDFSPNGAGNTIIRDIGPFNEETYIWQGKDPDAASDGDGGFGTKTYPIDPSKRYRFSVWVKRENGGNGRFYMGIYAYGTQNGIRALPYEGGTPYINENPYFLSSVGFLEDSEWQLVVGYVHPHSQNQPLTDYMKGIYNPYSTEAHHLNLVQFAWLPGNTTASFRTYMYYNTKIGATQKWVYPRFDLCDGTEPSIEDLVNGVGDVKSPLVSNSPWFNTQGMVTHKQVSNMKHPSMPLNIYNNHGVEASLIELKGETYLDQPIYRLRMKVDDPAYVDSFRLSQHSHGVYFGQFNFPQNGLFKATMIWRPISHPDTKFGGVASNIGGWVDPGNEELEDGWRRAVQTRTGVEPTRTDNVFFSVSSPSLGLLDEIVIDVTCPLVTTGHDIYEYTPTTNPKPDVWFSSDLQEGGTVSFECLFKENKAVSIISNGSSGGHWWGLYCDNNGYIYTHEVNAGASLFSSVILPLDRWVSFSVTMHAGHQKVYMDGVLILDMATDTSTIKTKLWKVKLGDGWRLAASNFRNLCFHKTVLTTEQMVNLFTPTVSIKEETILAGEVVTEERNIGQYYSFRENDLSSMRDHTAFSSMGCQYSDEGVLLSPEFVNVVKNADDWRNKWSLDYLRSIKHESGGGPPETDGCQVISFLDANDDRSGYVYCYSDMAPMYTDVKYACSLYVKTRDSNFRISFYTGDNREVGRYWSEYITVPNDGEWHLIKWADFINPSNSQCNSLSFHFYFGSDGEEQRSSICAPFLRRHDVGEQFGLGAKYRSRMIIQDRVLAVARPDDYSNEPFYVCGWWKPIYPSHMSEHGCITLLTDFNKELIVRSDPDKANTLTLEHLGLTSGGFQSLGRVNTPNRVLFDQWNFFCLRGNRNEMSIFLGNEMGYGFSEFLTDTMIHNRQYGALHWSVGESSRGSRGVLGSYHRDYIFERKYISEFDIIKMFKKNMKFSQGKIKGIKNINTLDDIE